MKSKFAKKFVSLGLVVSFAVWLAFVAASVGRAAKADLHYQTAEEYDPSALASFIIDLEKYEIISPPNPPKPRYLPPEASLPSDQDLQGNWSEVTAGLQLSIRFLQSKSEAGDPVTAVVLLRNVTQEYIAVPVYCDDELFSFVVTRNGRNIPGPLPDRLHPQTMKFNGETMYGVNEAVLVIPPQTQTRHDIVVSAAHDMKEPGEYVITAIRMVIATGAFPMDKTGTQTLNPPPFSQTAFQAIDTRFSFGAKKISLRRPEVPYVELKSGNAIVRVLPSSQPGATNKPPETGAISPGWPTLQATTPSPTSHTSAPIVIVGTSTPTLKNGLQWMGWILGCALIVLAVILYRARKRQRIP